MTRTRLLLQYAKICVARGIGPKLLSHERQMINDVVGAEGAFRYRVIVGNGRARLGARAHARMLSVRFCARDQNIHFVHLAQFISTKRDSIFKLAP